MMGILQRKWTRLALLAAVLLPGVLRAGDGGGDHTDPVANIVLWCALLLVAGKLAGSLATRLGQPAVLGELVVGVLLGNLGLLGYHGVEAIKQDPVMDILARLGVVLLLFEVGLESTVAQMMKVGLSSLLVATVGVVTPFALGWGVGAWLVPEAGAYVHAFLGATLTATSVGITARVLRDLQSSQTSEARIILGAAVIDDVMGLVILAVVSGVITAAGSGTSMSAAGIAWIVVKATGFLVGALALGAWMSPWVFRAASQLKGKGVLLSMGLVFCFTLSYLANLIGLAPIVGAFAAGLILEEDHDRPFVERGERPLHQEITPITTFFVPLFFVLMGMRTDLRSFAQPGVLGLAVALTLVAVAGKLVAGLGVVGGGVNRVAVGVGMIPRGEVGLIFANIGMTLHVGGVPVITAATFSAVVIMVIVTTMMTPPLLAVVLRNGAPPPPVDPEADGSSAAPQAPGVSPA